MPRRWKRKPELLTLPNIPIPLYGVNPRTVLGGKWWNAERQAAYASTIYHCEACGVHKYQAKFNPWLEGHEVYDIDYAKGTSTYIRTTPLCPACHKYIHDGRLQWLLETRQISFHHYKSIIQHGDSVLAEAGLKRKSRQEREQEILEIQLRDGWVEWSEWRLIVNGQEFPPKFKSEKEWIKFNRRQS